MATQLELGLAQECFLVTATLNSATQAVYCPKHTGHPRNMKPDEEGQQTAWRQPAMGLQTNISLDKSVTSNFPSCRVELGPTTDVASDLLLTSSTATFQYY